MVGLMGAGKSSIGVALAARLHGRYWDSDKALRARESGADQIQSLLGWSELHRIEADNLLTALSANTHAVYGSAASVVLDDRVVSALADFWVVWLRCSVEELARRVQSTKSDRPLFSDDIPAQLERMNRERQHIYESVADQIVDTDKLDTEQYAEMIAAAIPGAGA